MIIVPSVPGILCSACYEAGDRVVKYLSASCILGFARALLRCSAYCYHKRPSYDRRRFGMAELPRLNGVIRALEQGQTAIAAFTTAEIDAALAFSTSSYDAIVFEMEHNPWDARLLRDCLQYMLNRRQIAESHSVAPAVTPLVRIPPNGNEKNQWLPQQALDFGPHGMILPD